MKIGIIGFGGMGGWHFSHYGVIEGVEYTAVYDINPERVAEARKQGVAGFDDLDSFLQSGLFDTVLVSTPNDVHCSLACAAMRAGKHVLCEKPVAMNAAEVDKMIATAKAMGVVFTVHHNRRWDKDFLTAKAVLESGKLGKAYSIQSRLHGSGGVMHGWRGEKQRGGGMLFDWGVHFLDQILLMLGFDQVDKVSAQLASVKTQDVDDYINLTLTMKNGLRVNIEIGTFVLKELPRWMLLGDQATAYITDFTAESGGVITLNTVLKDEPVILMTSNGPTRTFAPRPVDVKTESPLPEITPDYTEFYSNLRDAIDGKAELIVKPEQVRTVMRVIDKLFEAAETGTTLSMED